MTHHKLRILAIILCTLLALSLSAGGGVLVGRAIVQSQHTHEVQSAGEPAGACLLDTMEAAEPLLTKDPAVQAPLAAYVRLQSHRYRTVRCPDGTH